MKPYLHIFTGVTLTMLSACAFEQSSVVPDINVYSVKADPKREGYAREIALLAKEYREPNKPQIYDNKYLYVSNYDGKCSIVVEEMNLNRERINTYYFDACE